jgi:hypothetical protein
MDHPFLVLSSVVWVDGSSGSGHSHAHVALGHASGMY